jgi:hypothetical protein
MTAPYAVPLWQPGARWGALLPPQTDAGAAAPAAPADDGGSFTIPGLKNGLKQITPTLILVGIATGAAFAIGSILASYIVRPHPSVRRK